MHEQFEITTELGLKVSGLSSNPASPRKILALHGWLDNLNSFLPLMAELPEFDIIAVDLPGHGQSEHKSSGCIYHFIDTVGDVLGVAEALGLGQFDLMGHSMGAGVAVLTAAAAPNLVTNLFCLEGLGPLSAPAGVSVEVLQTHLRQVKRLPKKKFPVYGSEDEAVAARLLAGDMSDMAARLICRRNLVEKDRGFIWSTDARLRFKTAHPFTEEQVCAFLRQISCPAFVLRAVPGFPFDETQLEQRRACLNQLSYHEVAGNHHVHMDEAVVVAGLIRGFYERT